MIRQNAVGDLVVYWFGKADAALASARAERDAGRLDFAVNRAYFAAFYAASAVLLARDKRFVKHAGVRAAVHRELVKPGLLSAEWGRVFDRLFEGRQRADYLDLVRFEDEETDRLIDGASRFVGEMRGLAKD